MKHTKKSKHEFTWPFLISAVIFLSFVLLFLWSSPAPAVSTQPEVTTTVVSLSKTPLPQEYLENAKLTQGITLGGVILVVLILFGTFRVIRLNQPDVSIRQSSGSEPAGTKQAK